MAPTATWQVTHRNSSKSRLPASAGGSFDAGDRIFTCVRPPTFDSPTTRALHDSATNVLWAADSFGALFPGDVYDVAEKVAFAIARSVRAGGVAVAEKNPISGSREIK